jgi:NTE family protein
VILVLGPGWARSFAHVGVLRALHESKIPIAGIISTELGALVGAAYSNSRTIHEFEWSMLKLKSELFTVKGNLLGSLFGKASNGKDLEDAIETLFGAKELRDGRVPTRVLIQSPPGAAPTIIDSGPISKILRAASAIPGWMKPGDWNGSPAYSAGQQRPFPVSEARLMGSGPVIVIDVMDRAAIPAGKTAPEAVAYFKQAASTKIPAEADLIIRPDLRGIGYDQFDKRTEIVFSGKKAALSELARIKHLVGLP